MEGARRDVLLCHGDDVVRESFGGVVDVGVEEVLPVSVVEGGVEIVPIGVFVVPYVA